MMLLQKYPRAATREPVEVPAPSAFFHGGLGDDLRAARLSACSGTNAQAAGPVWRPASSHRFLDHARREIQQRAYLHTLMGVAGRSRDEVDGVPERPCLAQGPR